MSILLICMCVCGGVVSMLALQPFDHIENIFQPVYVIVKYFFQTCQPKNLNHADLDPQLQKNWVIWLKTGRNRKISKTVPKLLTLKHHSLNSWQLSPTNVNPFSSQGFLCKQMPIW